MNSLCCNNSTHCSACKHKKHENTCGWYKRCLCPKCKCNIFCVDKIQNKITCISSFSNSIIKIESNELALLDVKKRWTIYKV